METAGKKGTSPRFAWASLLLLLSAMRSQSGAARRRKLRHASSRQKGYVAAEHAAVSTTSHTWTVPGARHQDRPCRARPPRRVAGGDLPPGGLAREQRLRRALAHRVGLRRGYGVVSVQLLDDDATAWNSELARAG